MNNFEKTPQAVNALKNEHLAEKVAPITGAIHDRDNLDPETSKYLEEFKKTAEPVDFGYKQEKFRASITDDIREGTYVMSLIDGRNKFSEDFLDCTGTLFSGIDSKTGGNISFMSHQNPGALFRNDEAREKFNEDLNNRIDDLIKRCRPNTIDAVIFGGNDSMEDIKSNLFDDSNFDLNKINENFHEITNDKNENYRKSIKLLNNIIFAKLHYSPVVMSGFNNKHHNKDNSLGAYFDNDHRQLHMVRPGQNSINNESFLASDISSQIEKINKYENGK